ncbi:hypothetical protein [Bosea sp. (in: a-proteobacteria)]|uniref:hypothetical protein n=1 Tax=Bosea sp. (in: a-proteobacteria) TaxID=1871050 RepID=UPI002735E32A|nr:hypothetical protein [Bosea sp. (in: a-proteobacteria)]MDP3256614.1 hypothetical protein [Bosea sp. (in: a-proteobacteria)]
MSALVEPSPSAPTQRRTDAPVARAPGTAKIWASLSVVEEIAALADEWRALEDRALVTPYQAYGWVRPFVETVGAAERMAFRHAVLRDAGGAMLAILPLVITRRSGIRFAEFIGGKHANYHMGIYDPAFAAGLDAAGARLMLAEIGAAIGGLDAFIFVNQPTQWQGVPNPLAQLAGGPSPSGAYKLALVPGDGEGSLRRSMSSHAHI